jgi:Ca2+-binding EF-hand superfamily protein
MYPLIEVHFAHSCFSGTIKVSELVDGLRGLKHGLSTDDIVALASELDENCDGEISLHEFEAIIRC